MNHTLPIQDTTITPRISDGFLQSIGSVTVNDVPLRSDATRFLPWFDTFEQGVFNRFRLDDITTDGDTQVLLTTAIGDSDYPFRERRDSSGDICFRDTGWDDPPLESALRICFKPAAETIDGREFTGFRYWFEYDNPDLPIHRLLDRQTWELGGSLDGVTSVCRNWLTPPRMELGRDVTWSTVGLDDWASLLPGNMWGRWSLLPGFDLQYSDRGVFVAHFDRLSLIRSALETRAGEDQLRCLDFHWFELSGQVKTNPKTALFCPGKLDHVDAINLWTHLQDREAAMVREQFGAPEEEPPAVFFGDNQWTDYHFDHSYEAVVETASEFGGDCVFIDSVWQGENVTTEWCDEQSKADPDLTIHKFNFINMCCVMEWEVANEKGGEAGLKALCDRAAEKGVKVITWIAAANSPRSELFMKLKSDDGTYEHGYAAFSSGRHDWTSYPNSYTPLNMAHPKVWENWMDKIVGVCERTGLAGALWDSYCNMGWWQVDYAGGTMRPNAEEIARGYFEMSKRGLYVVPEALVTFSNHSAVGFHGGNRYADDQLAFGYNSNESMHWTEDDDPKKRWCQMHRMIRGEIGPELLFRCFAHKRSPSFNFHKIPRDQWDPDAVAAMKECIAMYQQHKHLMQTRTVLKDDAGVLWTNDAGDAIFWCHRDQAREILGTRESVVDGMTGEAVEELKAGRVYRFREETAETRSSALETTSCRDGNTYAN